MATLLCGATTVPLGGLTKVIHNPPPNTASALPESVRFQYGNGGADVVLTVVADIQDALFAFPWIQSSVSLTYFPSVIA